LHKNIQFFIALPLGGAFFERRKALGGQYGKRDKFKKRFSTFLE